MFNRRRLLGVGLVLVALSVGSVSQTITILSPTTADPEYRNASNCGQSLWVDVSWSNMPGNCSFRVVAIRVGPISDDQIINPDVCPPSNGTATFVFDKSLCPLAPGAYDLTVVARYTDIEGVPRTVATTQPRAVIIEGTADLGVTKTASTSKAEEGDIVEFTVLAENNGPNDATGVVVQDRLPVGLAYISHTVNVGSYNPTTGRWYIGDLEYMGAVQPCLTIRAQVEEGTVGRNLVNRADIHGALDDPYTWNNSASATIAVLDNDSDDDGLIDPEDPCPTDPDCDDDGVPDGEDPCPETPGAFCGGGGLQVVISEVYWAGSLASPNDQWIELYNPGDSEISLDGWTLMISYPDGKEAGVPLAGAIPAHGYYLLERGGDWVVKDIPADLIFSLRLAPEGGTVKLVSPQRMVVDIANPDGGPWPAGLAINGLRASMERVDPEAPGDDENWKTNNTALRIGVDASGNPINGTPKQKNSCQ